MTGWDDRIDTLRQRFVERAATERSLLSEEVQRDRNELEMIAHRISGSAGMFGFAELGKAAEQLEEALRDQCDEPALEKHVRRLRDEIDRLQPR